MRAKILEHIFLGECLRSLWKRGYRQTEVLRADIDAAGYDLVIEANGTVRHIQLKTSRRTAKADNQKVNARLGEKPSGCVIWMNFDPETMALGPFYWFGAAPGERLPNITSFKPARHTKGDATGTKANRRNTFCIPKSRFEKVGTLDELLLKLFPL
jgi:hypothetical protein